MKNTEQSAGWMVACRTETGKDYRGVIYCRESDLVGYTDLIEYRLATAEEMDREPALIVKYADLVMQSMGVI